jgi:hypothetical protein
MNSNVHPLVVVLVLAFTGFAILMWVWGSGEAASIGGPAELKADQNGHAYVQIQDKLVEHDANGKYLRTHNIGEMGVELFLGSFDFFSNGDILLRRGPDPRSVSDNVRAFQRHENQQSIEPDSPDSGLFRCELDTGDCARFGQTGIDFKAAHGVFIDRNSDEVYVSDTTRHLIRKYSSDGSPLSDPVSGFRFPNQILIHDGELFVADTNHHEVRVVASSTGSFGDEVDRIEVAPKAAVDAGQTWPSHFASVGDGWWVNNMRMAMDQGGIYLFDHDWSLERVLELPDDADPIALLAFNDEVWISDWNNDKVRRFSMAGEPLADLDSAGLEEILTHARTERWRFKAIGYSGIALIFLLLGGLGVWGFAVSMSKDPAKRVRDESSIKMQSAETMLFLEPDEKILRRIMRASQLLVLATLILTAFVVFLIVFYAEPGDGLGFVLPCIGMLIIVFLIRRVNHSNFGTAIRIDGKLLTLRDYSGRESSCPLSEVRYDDTLISTHDATVFLGRPPVSIYRQEDLKEKLFPRLAEAQKVSALQMQKILVQQRHPQGVTMILAIVALLIYGAWRFVG